MDKETIKSILLAHGFTIKPGETDLRPYVYNGARAVYEAGWTKCMTEVGDKSKRRERIAVKFAQGLLASDNRQEYAHLELVRDAIRCADLFIAELDKDQSK